MTTTMYRSQARVPFGEISGSRLMKISNLKNAANVPTMPIAGVKRALVRDDSDCENDENAENIPPAQDFKKGKGQDGAAFTKPVNHFTFKAAPSTTLTSTPVNKLLGQKRSAVTSLTIAPASAPSSRVGLFKKNDKTSSIRRQSAPFKRIDPPSFAVSPADDMSFSIDAALAGTISKSSTKSKKLATAFKNEFSKPFGKASWDFTVYCDTPDEELGNRMQFSAENLDISDDEKDKVDKNDRGKENIAPLDHVHVDVIIPQRFSPAPRTPLGDLQASDFYAPGLDASSVVVVEETAEDKLPVKPLSTSNVKALTQQLNKGAKKNLTFDFTNFDDEVQEEVFQVWESESAKADNDDAATVIVSSSAPVSEATLVDGVAA